MQQHDEESNEHADELHDRELFTQPDETHLGECPLCFLPLPIDLGKSRSYSCCSQIICNGCILANVRSNKHDQVKARSCAFCRELVSKKWETRKNLMKRVKANDPAAMRQMGLECYREGNCDGAIEYYTKAAELGNFHAHFKLGVMRMNGEGGEKDEEKAVYHWEKAAIGGHPQARYNLGCYEERHGTMERSVKHFVISANLGFENSMKALWKHYSAGNITKEDLDATLRTHQAAIDAMKTAQRDAAEVAFRKFK